MKLQNIIITILALSATVSFGFDYPMIPKDNNRHNLFKIERNRDANEIMYDLNFDSRGYLDQINPINIYWIKKTENNHLEPLTWVQNSYAYGINILDKESSIASKYNDRVDFQFVSYNKRTFTIKKDALGNYKAFTSSKGKEIEVTRIYVQIDGGSFWVPFVSRVELQGKDISTGKIIIETIYP